MSAKGPSLRSGAPPRPHDRAPLRPRRWGTPQGEVRQTADRSRRSASFRCGSVTTILGPMNLTEESRSTSTAVGYVLAAVIAAWVVFALLDELEPNGRHLLVLGALRIVMLGALLAFAAKVGADATRLGRFALGTAALGALVNLTGGVGAAVTDGWSFNPFAPGGPAEPPWYAYLVMAGAMVFTLGTILVGIAGRRGGWLAVAVILGGILYAAVPLGAYGHLVWVAPGSPLALGLASTSSVRPRSTRRPGPDLILKTDVTTWTMSLALQDAEHAGCAGQRASSRPLAGSARRGHRVGGRLRRSQLWPRHSLSPPFDRRYCTSRSQVRRWRCWPGGDDSRSPSLLS